MVKRQKSDPRKTVQVAGDILAAEPDADLRNELLKELYGIGTSFGETGLVGHDGITSRALRALADGIDASLVPEYYTDMVDDRGLPDMSDFRTTAIKNGDKDGWG